MQQRFEQMGIGQQDEESKRHIGTPKRNLRPGLSVAEPSYMEEFREISSQYILQSKEDSAEISSNSEFDKADKMQVYNEEDTQVLNIENIKRW